MGTYSQRRAAEHSAETNRSGPLKKIVRLEDAPWGDERFFEILECGHKGTMHFHEHNRRYTEADIARGRRRRCELCGRTTDPEVSHA